MSVYESSEKRETFEVYIYTSPLICRRQSEGRFKDKRRALIIENNSSLIKASAFCVVCVYVHVYAAHKIGKQTQAAVYVSAAYARAFVYKFSVCTHAQSVVAAALRHKKSARGEREK